MFTPQQLGFLEAEVIWGLAVTRYLLRNASAPLTIDSPVVAIYFYRHFSGVNHQFPDSETCQIQSLILKSRILAEEASVKHLQTRSNTLKIRTFPRYFPRSKPENPGFPQVLPHKKPPIQSRQNACRRSASSRANIQAAGQKPGEPRDLRDQHDGSHIWM